MIKKKKKVVKKLKKKPLQKKRVIKKKVIRRKAARKSPLKKAKKTAKGDKKTGKKEGVVGTITHYFPHVQAAVIKLKAPLSVGDKIKVKGHTTDFTQVIASMQIDREDIISAKPGQEIGLLVSSRVRQHDIVTKV